MRNFFSYMHYTMCLIFLSSPWKKLDKFYYIFYNVGEPESGFNQEAKKGGNIDGNTKMATVFRTYESEAGNGQAV